MIISRTPFRISFFGGGTDYPVWYEENKGRVISTAINKYSFITLRELPPFFGYKHRLRYFKREEVGSIDEIEHPSIRECLKYLKIDKQIDLVHHADLPAQSGLGSSSTFTVGMLNACYAFINQIPTKHQLALDAITVEQEKIGESVGSQDQTIASFGGFNRIEFDKVNKIQVTPLVVSSKKLEYLQNNLMLFFTGFTRNAGSIAKKQIKLSHNKSVELDEMIELCKIAEKSLIYSDDILPEWGKLLNEQWKIKKSMTDVISNIEIDEIYEKGIKSGALGGKLLGAGGGGFFVFIVPEERAKQVRTALSDLLYVPFNFDFSGSQIVYYGRHS